MLRNVKNIFFKSKKCITKKYKQPNYTLLYSDVDRSEKLDFGPNSDQFLEWSEKGPKNGLKSDFLTSLDF